MISYLVGLLCKETLPKKNTKRLHKLKQQRVVLSMQASKWTNIDHEKFFKCIDSDQHYVSQGKEKNMRLQNKTKSIKTTWLKHSLIQFIAPTNGQTPMQSRQRKITSRKVSNRGVWVLFSLRQESSVCTVVGTTLEPWMAEEGLS